jgi:hypothetical protein
LLYIGPVPWTLIFSSVFLVNRSCHRPAPQLRWYWNGYKRSDHWLGDLSVGHEGLAASTRLQRTGLIESLLTENGEKPFAVLSRRVIKAEMKARTPIQAGNLLSALRGRMRWMIDEGHLDEDDDPTIRLRSGKAKASRESGGFLPWTAGGSGGLCRLH